MPSLDPQDRRALLGPINDFCSQCYGERVRHYCRSCDEFFATCECAAQPESDRHVQDHRVYLWTAAGVLAIPDFDVFMEALDR